MSRNQIFAAGATVAVLFGLALGFYWSGSPNLQRQAKADAARLRDLDAISETIRLHYSTFDKLPQSLTELNVSGPPLRLIDPETHAVYEYHPLDGRRFEPCAVFSTDNRTEARRPPGTRVHGIGRCCMIYPR